MTDDNTKNQFVVDEEKHRDDLQDLAALKRVKDAISKKKREIKDKDYLSKHPDLQDLVDAHRARKVTTKPPEKEGGKVKLELEEPKQVKADLGKKPEPRQELDYDKLAELVAQKMKPKEKPKKETFEYDEYGKPKKPKQEFDSDTEDEDEPAPPPKPKKAESEKKFNETIAKAPPKIQHVVARGGKFF
jgi:hypothetical protein